MRSFAQLFQLAARRHGGARALDRLLISPLSADELRAVPDDRWLSAASKCVFQSGFNWTVIEKKWRRFEEVFEGFDLRRWAMMSDGDVDRLLKTTGIVANGAKIKSVGDNARFLSALAEAHGSVGSCFAGWSAERYCENLRTLRNGGSRLGGRTGQDFLRRMGVDTLVFTPDVLKALSREGVVSKMPNSGKELAALQEAIDAWIRQSGRSLTHISQILAFSVD